MSAQRVGFRLIQDDVTLASSQNLQRKLQLSIGSLQKSITVTDEVGDASTPKNVVVAHADGETPDAKPCEATGTGGNIRPPKKLKDVAPEYPEALRGTGTKGVVILGATIGLDGFLKDIEILRDGGSQDLAQAAIAAVREWQYSQTLLNCSPVEVKVTIATNFTLHP